MFAALFRSRQKKSFLAVGMAFVLFLFGVIAYAKSVSEVAIGVAPDNRLRPVLHAFVSCELDDFFCLCGLESLLFRREGGMTVYLWMER
jgi:hypothetical protein